MQQGRDGRFEALYREHAQAVMAYLRRRTDREAARDVAAETFTVAWRRFDDVDDLRLPWLLGVARRQLANHRRARRRHRSMVARMARQPVADTVPAPALDSGLGQALSRLSENDRELVLLIGWDELTPTEAASVLGITPVAARSRLSRARVRLQQGLQASQERS